MLWVFEENGLARRFYERRGWRLAPGGAANESCESWAPAVVYERALQPPRRRRTAMRAAARGRLMLVAVTDHAVERYRQRIAARSIRAPRSPGGCARAIEAGRASDEPPARGLGAARGSLYVHDTEDRGLVFVCRRDRGEVVVVTLWERDDAAAPPRVPRRFTDALRAAPPWKRLRVVR